MAAIPVVVKAAMVNVVDTENEEGTENAVVMVNAEGTPDGIMANGTRCKSVAVVANNHEPGRV